MNLETHLRSRRSLGKSLLIPYVTGGLGEPWLQIVRAVAAAGADAVEIGIPFSDPIMDGKTIQEASQRALDLGATFPSIVAQAATLDIDIPIVVMSYYNPLHHAGHVRSASMLADAGIDGAIIPDLPLDEISPWADAADDAGVETVLLAAPTTPDDRLGRICERSRGFVYGVSLMGVTGERAQLASQASVMGERLKSITDMPVLLGVGISNPEQAVAAAASADGVIVGSALISRLLRGEGPDEAFTFVESIRSALDA